MSIDVIQMRSQAECEELIRAANLFIAEAYTRENALARRSYVYEYTDSQLFAFTLHCPGSPETDHLPGFQLDAMPEPLSEMTREVCETIGVRRGRVLFNVGRYPEASGLVAPHHDGELFDYTEAPNAGSVVHRAIRPPRVGIMTLRNESIAGGTELHDEEGKVIQPNASVGDLLRFDNLNYQHAVPDPIRASDHPHKSSNERYARYTIGWRALEDECSYWKEGTPLKRIDFADAIALHEQFIEEVWPVQAPDHLIRGHFPYGPNLA